jgi:hypothetical protein
VIGRSTLKCVSGFLNAHIKVEFLACLKQARSQNVRIPNMTVGADPVIQQLVRFSNKKQAATNRELQLDIQASIDSRISEEESQSMLLMAARIKMPDRGKVITKDRLSRLVFACTYTVSAATMRRGEDCYNQKIFQRFERTMKTIGPAGMICTFLVCNKAKHNTMGRLEYLAMAPHVDPLMDQSFWHGLLWLFLMLVNNFLFPDFTDWQTLFQLPTYPTNQGFSHFTQQQYRLLWLAFFLTPMSMSQNSHIYGGARDNKNLTKMVFPFPVSRG